LRVDWRGNTGSARCTSVATCSILVGHIVTSQGDFFRGLVLVYRQSCGPVDTEASVVIQALEIAVVETTRSRYEMRAEKGD
jgi:hypothetical protein